MKLRYPVGIETFAKIIEGKYAYVDKTEIIYRLTQAGNCFFLARPRRFGKSLMLSTMEAYFQAKKELFEGLWLGETEGVEWVKRPVFRMNFVDAECSIFGLQSSLEFQLSRWEEEYGCEPSKELNYGQRFYKVIVKAYQVTGQKVAVLIDEYDKLLVNSMHAPELHEELKQMLKPVFGVLKGADSYIHFSILTGVSRFSKLSVFSDLNNLRDISLVNEFATICGITQEELTTGFKTGIQDFADEEGVSFNEMVDILKSNYDGYHFSEKCPDIYNPFSLINAFADKKIVHRWFESGTPTFLVRMMMDTGKDIRELLTTHADSTALSSTDTMHSNLTAVMFQTGYLTIKGYNAAEDEYTLGIPNREVARGFFRCLLPYYAGQSDDSSMWAIRAIRNAVKSGNPEEMMEHLCTFLADIPYDLAKGRTESYFQNNLYIIFKLLGFFVQAEYRTSRGRIDILLQTPNYIYVMELKLDGTAEEALQQIEANDYCAPFANDPRTLFRIGMNFSKQLRNIDRWIIA